MADETNTSPDDLDDDSDESNGDAGQQSVTLESLQAMITAQQAEITALRGGHTKSQTDLLTAVGRLQSLQAKVDAGTGDAGAVSKLTAQMTAANEALDALLEDETVDPKVRAKATAARTKADANSEIAELRREMAAMKAARAVVEPTNAPSPFETGIVAAIEAAGLDPDDTALFDWRGMASSLLSTQGPAAATAYFKTQIAAGLEAKATAGRRQGRKDAAGGNVKPSGSELGPLDESRSAKERLEYLHSVGAI